MIQIFKTNIYLIYPARLFSHSPIVRGNHAEHEITIKRTTLYDRDTCRGPSTQVSSGPSIRKHSSPMAARTTSAKLPSHARGAALPPRHLPFAPFGDIVCLRTDIHTPMGRSGGNIVIRHVQLNLSAPLA